MGYEDDTSHAEARENQESFFEDYQVGGHLKGHVKPWITSAIECSIFHIHVTCKA